MFDFKGLDSVMAMIEEIFFMVDKVGPKEI
jgi:hypothetical protein